MGYLKDARTIITVGDTTTTRLLSFGIIPALSVIDGKERRKKIQVNRSFKLGNLNDKQIHVHGLECRNKPGSISKNAVSTLKDALKMPFPVRIFVYGEEDMLALPIFAIVPYGSVVLYGQPLKGIVIVKVNPQIRKKAKDLIYRIGLDSDH